MTAPASPPVDGMDVRFTGRKHDLKCWPEAFAAIRAGLKQWELRLNDRDYQIGDLLWLKEWCPQAERYTGEATGNLVIWMLEGPAFGLPSGYCIMSLDRNPALASPVRDDGPLQAEDRPSVPSQLEVEAAAKIICRGMGLDPDEHIIGGQAVSFEDFGPRWKAARHGHWHGFRDYEEIARDVLCVRIAPPAASRSPCMETLQASECTKTKHGEGDQ